MPKKASKASRKTGKKIVKKRKVTAKKVVEKVGTLPPPSISDATGSGDDWEVGEEEGEEIE